MYEEESDLLQIYDYNSLGQLTEWRYQISAPGESVRYNTSYNYSEEGDLIKIVSDETVNDETRHFEEELHLNENGTASHATGKVIIEGQLSMMKNYTVEFNYNSSRQLTKVDISEKRTNSTGWEEPYPLNWSAELEWNGKNLSKYSEYSNPAKPMITKSYSYYGDSKIVDYQPILQGPIVRAYYLPLQYMGILGKQSAALLKRMEISHNQSQPVVTSFSYDMETTINNSMVIDYTVHQNDRTTEYYIAWDNYDYKREF